MFDNVARKADRKPIRPEWPHQYWALPVVINARPEGDDGPANMGVAMEVYKDYLAICGVPKEMARRMQQVMHGIQAMVDANGYLVDTEIIVNNLKLVYGSWPNTIPRTNNTWKYPPAPESLVRLTTIQPYAAMLELEARAEFKFLKHIKGLGIWHSRRVRYENLVHITRTLWAMRNELGFATHPWIDPVILSIDRILYIGNFVDKEDPTKRYQFNMFSIGNHVGWMRRMFNTTLQVKKVKGEIVTISQPHPFDRNDGNIELAAEVLDEIRDDAAERHRAQQINQFWIDQQAMEDAYEELDSGNSNSSAQNNPPQVVNQDEADYLPPLRQPEGVEEFNPDNVRAYVGEPESYDHSTSDTESEDDFHVSNNDTISYDSEDIENTRKQTCPYVNIVKNIGPKKTSRKG